MRGRADRPLVLVIEDDLRYVRQLRGDLELCDCEAVVAGTGAGGLDVCSGETPDLVLLDLGLPDVDALTVLGLVRATCGRAGGCDDPGGGRRRHFGRAGGGGR